MTRPPVPDDQPAGNGRPRYDRRAGGPAQRARLAGFWALVLRRFRDYAQRGSAAAGGDRHQEGR